MLLGLGLSRVFFSTIESVVVRVFQSLALAPAAFPDHRAFYSYEFRWGLICGLLLVGTGIVLRLSQGQLKICRESAWMYVLIGLLVLDFASFGIGVNPAVDPVLLEYE